MPNDSSKPTEVTSTRNDGAVETTTAPEPQVSATLSDDELEAITGGVGSSVAMKSPTLATEGSSTARSGDEVDPGAFDCSELVKWAHG